MGRKKKLTYPPDADNVQRTEQWSYDTSGRLQTFTNRPGNIQTFEYDALNRLKEFYWNDGSTPRVDFGYDGASRLTSANNANANVTRAYYDDNLLQSETEQILLPGGQSKMVSYTYDADANRASTQYPDGSLFNYTYTNRNQLQSVAAWASYVYNARGHLITRTLSVNNTTSSYVPDTHDRVTQINHTFAGNGNTRTLNYGYWDENNSNDLKWTQRRIISPPRSPEDNKGEVFVYDLADQAIGVQLDVASPQSVGSVPASIHYDGNGNRMWFGAYEWSDTYTINNLNQYTVRTTLEMNPQATPTPRPTPTPRATPTPAPRPGEHDAAYDHAGNMSTGFDASSYVHDAQNRLTQATTNGVTINFNYDGFNRQVRRSVTGQPDTFSVWDGWDLIQEYQAANNGAATAAYLYGATGLIVDSHVENSGFNYYYQDASGSTSHVADATGHLLEWYRYDLGGTPFFYNANDSQLSASNYSVRHLFTGQQWYQVLGLYDLRNRFYSPDIGRFLQPDPIGFNGDRTNLYRYCRNNPVTRWDPSGLDGGTPPTNVDGSGIQTVDPVHVSAPPIDNPEITRILVGVPGFGGPEGMTNDFFDGGGSRETALRGLTFEFHLPPRNSNPSSQQSPSNPPPQNPPAPTVIIAAQSGSPGPAAPAAGVFVVVASEFAGGADYPLRSAYGSYDAQGRGPIINPGQLGASLPFRFPSNNAPPGIGVGVMNAQTGLSTSAFIIDVGPWNVRDNYWATGGVPLARSQFAAHAVGQNGQIVINPAGIDLTPATMDAIGATGPVNSRQVEVMWWFLTDH